MEEPEAKDGEAAAIAGKPASVDERESGAGPPVEALQAEIGHLKDRIADLEDRLRRALAEQENIRKRARRDTEMAVDYAAFAFAKDLVTSADNLRRALDSIPEERSQDEMICRIREGVEATERGLLSTFEKHGISRFDPLGETFDPDREEVVQVVPGSEKPEGTVVQVLQPGYLYRGRLLRPAFVNIAGGHAE